MLTIPQIFAIVAAGEQLVATGVATVQGFQAWLKSLQPGLTDADLNAIAEQIKLGAARHKAIALADAGA